MNYFYLLNERQDYFIYVHVDNIHSFKSHIKSFSEKNSQIKIYLIYSSEHGKINIESDKINSYYTNINFEPTLLNHNAQTGYWVNKKHNEEISSLYNSLCLTYEEAELQLKAFDCKRTLNPTLNQRLTNPFNGFFCEQVNSNEECILSIEHFVSFLNTVSFFPQTFNFVEFIKYYRIPIYSQLLCRTFYKTITFENVYYRNKGFYNKDGSFYDISLFKNDIEYNAYNKIKLRVDKEQAVCVDEPVLFLDYIYDFYNFGEVWDVVQRISNADIDKPIKVYGLNKHRVNSIEKYFSENNLEYPPTYIRDYSSKDEKEETNKGSTFFFKKLYISTINNACRGALNPWAAFKMNYTHNINSVSANSFKIYLSRGKERRGMVNEEILMNSLKNQGFVVLDGSESLEEQIFYFTNASIIVGVHSSLMKNMVWCKKNPIFVDLCPATRANFDMNGNALSLGFTTVIIVLENNKLEEISISEEKMSMLSKFISLLTKSLD
jgi:hypothetical protein